MKTHLRLKVENDDTHLQKEEEEEEEKKGL